MVIGQASLVLQPTHSCASIVFQSSTSVSISVSLLGFFLLPNPIESRERGGGVFVSRESEKDFESVSGKSPLLTTL